MIFAKGSYIEIDEKRCLNRVHHGVECNHCIGHCPAGAILCYNDHIYLHRESCTGCGLCFSDCPTQVFRSKQWDETTIIRDIEGEGWTATEFFCARHTLPYKMDKTKGRGAVQLPACLSIVSKGAWYESGLITELELHLDQCQECPLAANVSRLKYNAGMAAEWLAASGHAPSLSYIHQGCQGKIKKSLLAIETGLKVTSRRDLFISIIQKGQELAGQLPQRTNDFPEEPDPKMRNRCLPDWQQRLKDTYMRTSEEGTEESSVPAYWPTIKINDQCVNCGMCSHFCPSGTLQTTVKDGVCNHYFTSGLCLDCRICQLFCPRQAISRGREQVERPFEAINIRNNSTNRCMICESTTNDHTKSLCYWCEQEAVNDNEMKNSFRRVFLKTSV